MAYENFQSLIDSLYSGVSDIVEEEKNIIEINEKRQFIPKDLDTVIAYEGDINSQIITFKSIRYSDDHDLSACQNHEIRWKNLVSNVEGNSKLLITEDDIKENVFYARWEVPAEMCTQAGNIEISIAYYDKNATTKAIIYSWNTSSYTNLSIGRSMDSVGFQFPAKNEILVINKETRAILAPSGYNNTVCNYGDIGVSTLYFLVDRYIGQKNSKIDIFDNNTKISIYITLNGKRIKIYSEEDLGYWLGPIEKKLYTEEISGRINEGMVFIAWPIPKEITCNDDAYSGRFKIAIEFFIKNGDVKEQAWHSNNYNFLEIGPGIDTVPLDDEGTTAPTDLVYSIIEQFFKDYDITITNNE